MRSSANVSGREANGARFSGSERHGLANLMAFEFGFERAGDLRRAGVVKFGLDGEIGLGERFVGEMRDHLRISESRPGRWMRRQTSRQRPMSLSGGVGFQSTQLMPRSFSVCAMVSTASAFGPLAREKRRDVEFVGAIGAGDFVRFGDPVAVEPDVGAIVDAAEIQPDVAGRRKPSARWNSVRYHQEQRNGLSFGIGSTENILPTG